MERSAPARIAMVAYTYYPWDPRVRREAETLTRMGRQVSIVCARDEGERPRDTVAGVSVRRVPIRIRRGGLVRYLYQYVAFLLLAGAALRGLRRQEGVAAIHAHSLPDLIAFVGLRDRLRGRPLVLDLHEAMPEIFAARFPHSRFGRRLAEVAEKISCLVATRVIVVNETIRELLIARGVPSDRLLVVYNSPDLAAADRATTAPRATPSGRLRLVYAGTIDKERDLATLFRAIAALRKTKPVALELYGPGPAEYRAYLEGLVDGLGLRDSVRFGGVLPPSQVLAHLAEADVGVVTYERNPITEVGLPNKVFEFVVLDKPLVLPDLRAMRRAFHGAALFYQPGNPGDLAAKILAAAASGPDAGRMRERARLVYEAATWDVQAQRLASVYATAARD